MPEEQVHLMVECMESWFLADRGRLREYYGEGFRENALPGTRSAVEDIPKGDVLAGLARAAGQTAKGAYHKTRHAFEILAGLDPTKVIAGSPHARALFLFLRAHLR